MKLSLAALIGLCLLSLSSCQEEQLVYREYINLSDAWYTDLGSVQLPGTTDEAALGDTITNLNETGHLSRRHSFVGALTYEHLITIPESFRDKHISLVMERTKPSTLWIDDDSIASFSHLYAPHIYDITGIKPGEHRVRIRIDNGPNAILPQIGGSHAVSEHTQTNWNGILGLFYIEATDNAYIHSVQVYPNTADSSIKVRAIINRTAKAHSQNILSLTCEIKNYDEQGSSLCSPYTFQDTLRYSQDTISFSMPLPQNIELWSEWHPNVYSLVTSISVADSENKSISVDRNTTSFGVRDFHTVGTQFNINGKRTFLRGKHDACVFPLTGYAPMDVDSWRAVYRRAKAYGINHYRFHSWAPPRAAFVAADLEGIYLQPELPYWGGLQEADSTLLTFLHNEGEMLLDFVGNHPSFTMMALGNELSGDTAIMHRFVTDFKRQDNRHLYSFGSNNFLGWMGQLNGEDFWVTCRAGAERHNEYNSHVRSSFSFADAHEGGILNGSYPNTVFSYEDALSEVTIPVISHESCQFQIYPDSNEIKKYTGVLRPLNHEIFHRRLRQANLDSLSHDFHLASGYLSMLCYKADIEACLRTMSFGGFQLLDLQDYPGQGSALCAPLDAFMDPKEFVDSSSFSAFCSEIVPLAILESFVMPADSIAFSFAVANYSERALSQEVVRWGIRNEANHVLTSGTFKMDAIQGNTTYSKRNIVENISDSLKCGMSSLILTVNIANHTNTYNIWAIKANPDTIDINPYISHALDNTTLERLENGETVIFNPLFADIDSISVGGLFTPDYWNYAMFKSISESINQPVSPGTLGYLIDVLHPIFNNNQFSSAPHSDFQWWPIAKNSRPLILDSLKTNIPVIVRAIDNVERNHSLGILLECRVANGTLIICTTNLEAIAEYAEGKQYIRALAQYAANPTSLNIPSISYVELQSLFHSKVEEREIQGVKNNSDYKRKQ
ncbi:MAG: glycoside hydrolase [Bacteroidia bacterium]|nr:glycoside hydrolase [Bacteroidia bacterium]